MVPRPKLVPRILARASSIPQDPFRGAEGSLPSLGEGWNYNQHFHDIMYLTQGILVVDCSQRVARGLDYAGTDNVRIFFYA